MSQSRKSFPVFLLCIALVMPAIQGVAQTQAAVPADSKLALKAALVLTPDFCKAKPKKGTWMVNQETFDVGKAVCAELPLALKDVFLSLAQVSDDSAVGDAQVTLTPEYVSIQATQAKLAFSNRELTVQVQWTAKDTSGKTIWIETVQGYAKHHMGNEFTYKKNLKLVVMDSAKDLARQSASRMSASAELRKYANAAVK